MCPTRTRGSRAASPYGLPAYLDHHDPGAELDALVEIADVLVANPDAAWLYRGPDRPRLVGAVNAVERRAKIHGARAKRIVGAAFHVARQGGPAVPHFVWR